MVDEQGNKVLTHNTDEILAIVTVVAGCIIGISSFAAHTFLGTPMDFEQLTAILGVFVLTPLSYVFGKTRE